MTKQAKLRAHKNLLIKAAYHVIAHQLCNVTDAKLEDRLLMLCYTAPSMDGAYAAGACLAGLANDDADRRRIIEAMQSCMGAYEESIFLVNVRSWWIMDCPSSRLALRDYLLDPYLPDLARAAAGNAVFGTEVFTGECHTTMLTLSSHPDLNVAKTAAIALER